ncbi:MAG: glutathione S-transferase family protein [Alphaproteobacteria bacterium]|nr:glutathione S-transferase family protein [Alphaproteobacteria bacterium]
MIDLYAMTSPNVQKIFLMLEEVGLPYNAKLVDVWKGEQFRPEFTRLNPNAKVPLIVDHDGPGGQRTTVFESGAILIYLAEKAGILLPTAPAERYPVLQWLMVQLTGVGPMFGQYNHFKRFAPAGTDYSLSRYTTEVRRLYDLLDRRLGEAPYLGGPDYTIADIATVPWIRAMSRIFAKEAGFQRAHNPELPRLWAWVDRILERPAAVRAFARIDGIQSTVGSATPDDLDRIFQRGRYARA